ncbi:MAG: VCBS repeat-containing protein [Planctomycetes bacterium]|nr:VCBS repeat-containing protein [Planctomycetota bacterium]
MLRVALRRFDLLQFVLLLCILFVAGGASVVTAAPVKWKRVALDGVFRSEGVTAVDVNRDGKTDVIAGELWYEAPNWIPHEIAPAGDYNFAKGYSDIFGGFSYDVNGDGWEDYIAVGFPGAACYWFQNPQNNKGHWQKHEIWHEASNESPNFGDINGDGKPELVLGADSQLGFLAIPAASDVTKKWTFHPLCEKGDAQKNGSFRFYHGLGHGDLNGDGYTDVLIPHGWYEGSASPASGPWKFHPYALAKEPGGNPLRAAHLHPYDLDLDGDQDIIMSSAHTFGLWWFENLGSPDNTEFKYHLIDESFSQTHSLQFTDINGDGHKDLITGKRFYAHNGRDPGGKDTVTMYWIEVHRQKGVPPTFTPHEIVEGRDTGIGTQFLVKDINGDGLLDIVLSNKKGVNLLIQSRN